MLIVDSREKWTNRRSRDRHIKGPLERMGVAYRIEKLDVGDYMLDGGKVSVDRKQGLEELARNLLNRQDRARFLREVKRANEQGIKLVILIEEKSVQSVADLKRWHSQYTPATGQAVYDRICRVMYGYGVGFRFCLPKDAAKKIIEILSN